MPLTVDKMLCLALFDAINRMGISTEELVTIIDMDDASTERLILMADLDMNTRSGGLALNVIDIYRSLRKIVGTDPEILQHWLRTENTGLNGIPAELMKDEKGLKQVLSYLVWIGHKG